MHRERNIDTEREEKNVGSLTGSENKLRGKRERGGDGERAMNRKRESARGGGGGGGRERHTMNL